MAELLVSLLKKVTGEALEQACTKAAEELGYRAKSKDDFSVSFSLDPSLGSIRFHRDYQQTKITLMGLYFITVLQVRGIKRGQEQDDLRVWTGLLDATATLKEVQDYLEAVSKHLYYRI